MLTEKLEPRMELLYEEYVLVQAWKKTASFIRYHNWYFDTLALDHAAVNLPDFIHELRQRLLSSDNWSNKYLRIVPAPKSQRWTIQANGNWVPARRQGKSTRLRPLAHVDLAEQVAATAVMLCLADRVESLQGDTRIPIADPKSHDRVISFGNRLYCDEVGGKLRHRWGSAKLYRAYYEDYRTFLSRPKKLVELIPDLLDKNTFVVHADLKQFYDRVSPNMLSDAIHRIIRSSEESDFFSFVESLLNWNWHPNDEREVKRYARESELGEFTTVVLPQGLVASGFFANVILLNFDDVICASIGSEIDSGIRIVDACRYVDDLRILISIHPLISNISTSDLEVKVSEWLSRLLDTFAGGLELSEDKTQVVQIDGDERPLLQQSLKMNQIQSAVSGGFDALGGEEILDSIQGLMQAQAALRVQESNWKFSPVPDVRDETVARFSAARYRSTYRSIRSLLPEIRDDYDQTSENYESLMGNRFRTSRTRSELDGNAKVFAFSLVQRWIDDPSNVRLLRIGLDIWPDLELLREVLNLLRPYTLKGGRRNDSRRVAWYCHAEILRAGSTETGLTNEAESLPSQLDIDSYRKELYSEAIRIVNLPRTTVPWYLRQQAFLFMAAYGDSKTIIASTTRESESKQYLSLIRFLAGDLQGLKTIDLATLAIITRRSFLNRDRAIELITPFLNRSLLQKIARTDPSFCIELFDANIRNNLFLDLPPQIRYDLCLDSGACSDQFETLPNLILKSHPKGCLRNELSLLYFSVKFIDQWRKLKEPPKTITPGQVAVKLRVDQNVADVENVQILNNKTDISASMYEVPSWCNEKDHWRFQLGFLLRFILSGQPDFTRPVRRISWKEDEQCYRPAESHWYQRLHGLYTGQPAFGDDWLPISEWSESLLLALMRWPGCHISSEFKWVGQSIGRVRRQLLKRIEKLEKLRGRASGLLLLPIAQNSQTTIFNRSLRACVVQTVIPTVEDYEKDLTLDDPGTRQKHRNHLSAALAAVEKNLTLRGTHKCNGWQLDWLILPELSVHPDDVHTHLIPFARAHKTIVLCGLSYQELFEGEPLINSALWVIPEYSKSMGLQIRIRRQGKYHLAADEQKFNGNNARRVQGFRPCQWLIGYPWSKFSNAPLLRLTSSVCYDATDLDLIADLRTESDVFAIPALNRDVKTFDQMALALHYHMYQIVVVANNGQYGGSNAYFPHSNAHIRRMFHTHGQEQVSIKFFEIEDIKSFIRHRRGIEVGKNDWKYPPAGLL